MFFKAFHIVPGEHQHLPTEDCPDRSWRGRLTAISCNNLPKILSSVSNSRLVMPVTALSNRSCLKAFVMSIAFLLLCSVNLNGYLSAILILNLKILPLFPNLVTDLVITLTIVPLIALRSPAFDDSFCLSASLTAYWHCYYSLIA